MTEHTGEHKSLEEHVLENIDAAAKTAEEPARQALQTADFFKKVVVFLSFYTALVAVACTYSIYKVQQNTSTITRYLVTQCSSGNETRSAERAVISTLIGEDLALAELEGYVPSKEELDALKRISDAADVAWPQLDCSTVKDGRRVVITPLPTTVKQP